MVIGSGFTLADALRIAAAVLDSGKALKTILISDADPDYYFGAEALQALFPDAQVVATQPVAQEIREHLQEKMKEAADEVSQGCTSPNSVIPITSRVAFSAIRRPSSPLQPSALSNIVSTSWHSVSGLRALWLAVI